MYLKQALLVVVLLLTSTLSITIAVPNEASAAMNADGVADLVQKDRLISTADGLTDIALSNPAFRVAGSKGANQSADLILSELSSLGLDAWKEEFNSIIWDIASPATLSVDMDGNESTTDDIVHFSSFMAEAFSSPLTSNQSLPLEAIYLPVMNTRADWEWLSHIPLGIWDDLNLTGKIVVVPKEIRWNFAFETKLAQKIALEHPAGVVFAYGFEWDSFAVDMSQSSAGGMPLSRSGTYLHDNKVAVGSLNYSEGTRLFQIESEGNCTARMYLPSSVSQGKLANVVGVLPGTSDREVLVTAHYDSVMCPGYLDNAGGVAAMLETARCMVQAKQQGWNPACTVRFIAFTGEEMGLLGSGAYVSQHGKEMVNVKAVLNLDCLGGDNMLVSEPIDQADLQMTKIITREANRFGVPITASSGEGGSDHYAFQRPLNTIRDLNGLWGAQIPTNNLTVLADVVMLSSSPLTIFESEGGRVGLIHTMYDSPEQTRFTYWMDGDRFYSQSKVAVSCAAVLANEENGPVINEGIDPLPIVVIGFVAVSLILFATYYLEKRRRGK